jgi:type IV pilus assembly protein PilN
MIRINLLAVEREAKKKKATFQSGQKVTLACGLILILTVAVVGWRYYELSRESSQLDEQIAAAQTEATRLHGIIKQVQAFESQKAQLQQRVVLIEQLRKSQTGPVHMLDQLSKSLPPMLWLTNLKQDDTSIVIDGKSTSQTGVSDFVSNLESSGYFKKSVEIINSQADNAVAPKGVTLVKFQLKAQYQSPNEPAPGPGRGGVAGRGTPAPSAGRK